MSKTKYYFFDTADRLEELIIENGTKYRDLEKLTGYKRNAIMAWKYGYSVPNARVIKLLAEYFNVSADYLVGLTNKRSSK